MYRIRIDDSADLKRFLTLADQEYIDIFLSNEKALIVCNSSESFLMLMLPCACSLSDGPISLRIKRDIVKSLYCDGDLEFVIKDSHVSLSFINTQNSITCTVKFELQNVFSNVYSHKMQLLQNINEYDKIAFQDIDELYKIAKSSHTPINIDSGVAAVYLLSGARVYKPVSFTGSLCLTAKSFEMLRRCGSIFFEIENFVGCINNNLVVLVTKCRCFSNGEFATVVGETSIYKANFIADVDFTNLLRFVSVKRPKRKQVNLDINKGVCYFNADSEEVYEIPVTFSNKQIAQNAVVNNIIMPISVVNDVLMNVNTRTFKLKKKKSFYELSNKDNIYIVFG